MFYLWQIIAPIQGFALPFDKLRDRRNHQLEDEDLASSGAEGITI